MSSEKSVIFLAAKHRKIETRGTESGFNEVKTDHTEAASPSKGGSSAEASTSRSSDEIQDHNIKQPGDRSYSDELPISSELSGHENGDYLQEFGEQVEQEKHIGSLDQDTGGEGKHELSDGSIRRHRARSFSDDLRSSMELTCNETEDSSPEFHSCMSRDKDVLTFDPCIRMDTKEDNDCKKEQDKGINLQVSTKTEDKHRENGVSPKFGLYGEEGKNVNLLPQNCASVERKVAESADYCRQSSSFSLPDYAEHEKPTTITEANQEIGKSFKDHRADDGFKAEDNLGKSKTGSVYAAENSVSLDNQHLEKNITPSRDFDCGSSVDSFDKLPLDSPSSVFGMKHTDFSKSSMPGNYYAYEGSVSSFDGYEDQIPGQYPKPPRRRFKHSNGLHRHEESRNKDFLTNKSDTRHQAIRESPWTHGMQSSESEIRKSLLLDENNRYGMKHRQNKLDDLPEYRSYGHPSAGRSRGDKEDHAAGISLIPRYSGGQRNGTPLNYQHRVFQPYSDSLSPDMPSYAEPDREQLLRMVHELTEELNRTQISKSRYITGDEIHAPLNYSHLAPAEEICADMHFSRYPGTGLPPLHRKVSRMSYSGETADYRHQVDCSCLHGCPHDWHCSGGQVASPTMCQCHNRAHCAGHHSGHVCYKGFYSASTSPQHYRSSRLSLYGRETKSDEQNLQDTDMKRHVRERVYSSKRHLMPVAGGIPIVACYHCSELLQLPADFLLFGRRYHRLKCNSCGKIMKFSLESGTHLRPKIHASVAPPPSMVEDCDDQRHLGAASHASKHPHAEAFSCSDDYGMSLDRSCSTEGEPSPMMMPSSRPPLQSGKTSSSGNGSSFQPLEDRKMKSIMGESRETIRKNSKEKFRSEVPSLKISKWGKSSSEIEELPSTSVSPLHRLMGYLSPSEVMDS